LKPDVDDEDAGSSRPGHAEGKPLGGKGKAGLKTPKRGFSPKKTPPCSKKTK